MRNFFCFIILIFSTHVFGEDKKPKVPVDDAFAAAEKTVKEAYAKNLKSDASFWIKQATETNDNSDARYVMLTLAFEKAKDDVDLDASLTTLKLMKKYYDLDFITLTAMADKCLLGLPPKYALIELSDALSTDDITPLADEWWKLSETLKGKQSLATKQRAVTLYKMALPNLSGLTAKTVANRIEKSGLKNTPEKNPKVKIAEAGPKLKFDPAAQNKKKVYVWNWVEGKGDRATTYKAYFYDNGTTNRNNNNKKETWSIINNELVIVRDKTEIVKMRINKEGTEMVGAWKGGTVIRAALIKIEDY